MSNSVIDKTTEICATAAQVWRIFTDPEVTRQIGGEYVSDWQVGSAIGFQGLDGTMLTNGTILQIEPEKLLQHRLFNSVGSIDSVITYELQVQAGHTTILHSREEFSEPVPNQAYAEAAQGWDAALEAVKALAEG